MLLRASSASVSSPPGGACDSVTLDRRRLRRLHAWRAFFFATLRAPVSAQTERPMLTPSRRLCLSCLHIITINYFDDCTSYCYCTESSENVESERYQQVDEGSSVSDSSSVYNIVLFMLKKRGPWKKSPEGHCMSLKCHSPKKYQV